MELHHLEGHYPRIDTKDGEIAELEGENHDLKGRLDLASAEIQFLKERIVGLEREEDLQAKMLAMMQETLGRHTSF